jgi:hypothetical protein
MNAVAVVGATVMVVPASSRSELMLISMVPPEAISWA